VLFGEHPYQLWGKEPADLAHVVGGMLGEQRCSGLGDRFDALGFLVELQKLCRMEDGFALFGRRPTSLRPCKLRRRQLDLRKHQSDGDRKRRQQYHQDQTEI
jgi:hypothetical protein